jgi:signal transduction histidine kinase
MTGFIRYRLLTILLLGVVTSALSVVALVQLLTTSTAQRVERARDAVIEEVDRVARAPGELSEATRAGFVAMRGGVITGEALPPSLPSYLAAPLREAVAASRARQAEAGSGDAARVVLESPDGAGAGGTIVVGVRPLLHPAASGAPPGSVAFVTFVVRPLPSLRTWQRIVALLSAATVLLVATAVYSVVTVNRGAAALRASLEALAFDLRAPVPRPSVRELDAIADGIAGLAQKLAEARVKEARLARELAQNERLAALGRVAAGVAHEVRNPLASIKLRLDLAANSPERLPPAAEAAIAHATSEIDRLDRLVADLLVVAGRKVGPKGRADLGELVRARAFALTPWAAERGVTLTGEGSGLAVADADALARAVDNLLRNAVEASPPGATVVARVELQDGTVVVRIEDHGPGVPSARTKELFEPFFTTKPSGTGLGLAISRAIARAHGGDVVYAREGELTSFALSVAVASADEGGARVAA